MLLVNVYGLRFPMNRVAIQINVGHCVLFLQLFMQPEHIHKFYKVEF